MSIGDGDNETIQKLKDALREQLKGKDNDRENPTKKILALLDALYSEARNCGNKEKANELSYMYDWLKSEGRVYE